MLQSRHVPLILAGLIAMMLWAATSVVAEAKNPNLIFKKTTVWKFLSPDHKIGTYAIDDPDVEGIACHFSVPEKGGWTGWLGLAEELSQSSLSCKQYGPVKFKRKLEQGEEMFSQRRSIFFKKMQIVRGCDAKRNMLVYLVYTDKLIDGSPDNSTSTIAIMPWGTTEPPRCADWISE